MNEGLFGLTFAIQYIRKIYVFENGHDNNSSTCRYFCPHIAYSRHKNNANKTRILCWQIIANISIQYSVAKMYMIRGFNN